MSPSRLKRRSASTLYVRVPRQDWPLVKRGVKTEFRMAGRHAIAFVDSAPTPVIAWCPVRYGPVPEQQLMVLLEMRQEPLGAISAESLEREGFATRKEFVRYWTHRGNGGRVDNKTAFKPLSLVSVYRLRLWQPEDCEGLGALLVKRLYGHALEADATA